MSLCYENLAVFGSLKATAKLATHINYKICF